MRQPDDNAARPFTVTIVLLSVFLIGAWNAGRVFALYRQQNVLQTLDARPDPLVVLTIAALWAVVFLGLAAALWGKRPFTRIAIPITIGVYGGYEVGLQTILAPTPPLRAGWRFTLLLYTGITLYTAWALNRTTAKVYLEGKRREREIETSD